MTQTYTSENLLLYLYGETDPTETRRLERELAHSPTLQRTLATLKAAKGMLPPVKFAPRPTAIDAILKYSTASQPVTHKP